MVALSREWQIVVASWPLQQESELSLRLLHFI